MSGTTPDDPLFLRAVHEAGHLISGISLGIPCIPNYLTIQPYGRSGGACNIKFLNEIPVRLWGHYCLGGVIAEGIFDTCQNLAKSTNEFLPQELGEMLLSALKKAGDTSGRDLEILMQHPDYQDHMLGEVSGKCVAFTIQHAVDIKALAHELLERTTLHGDESTWFLNSQLLFLRQKRQRGPDIMDLDGIAVRPDLEHQEPFIPLLKRLSGGDLTPYTEWTRRFEGAYFKIDTSILNSGSVPKLVENPQD